MSLLLSDKAECQKVGGDTHNHKDEEYQAHNRAKLNVKGAVSHRVTVCVSIHRILYVDCVAT